MIRDEREHRKIAKSRYINPMIDGGFKILFGSEKSKELPETLGEKPIRYDILCRDADGNKYLLERCRSRGTQGCWKGLSTI